MRDAEVGDTLPQGGQDDVGPVSPATDPRSPDGEVARTLPPENAAAPAPSAADPPVASWDRYELLEQIGQGGMGVVYKARDRRLGRIVAIKFVRGADPNLTFRLVQEARAQARLEHPNICRIYEVAEVEGKAYIALQFVDGVPLHAAAAGMSLADKLAVMRDVALAMAEAHRLQVVHRDLKPANILVERTEHGRWFPVIMDFGLAREATVETRLTESGMPLGTPAYMPPEQARGDTHGVGRWSDVYSLGATLYELLTGRPPFTSTYAALLLQVLHDDPPAPRSLVPSLPVDVETIVVKCLAKDPAHRYPTARALAEDLGRHLDGEPILGRRLPVWQRVRMRARRHRGLVLLAACSLVVTLCVAAWGVRQWLASRREHELAEQRSALAAQLGANTKELELQLQIAYQLPLHDTRRDRASMQARMQRIATTRHELGPLGDAMVHVALGRGHLALHQWREAADELRRAEATRLAPPELHAALGRALGELYRRALDGVLGGLPEDSNHARDTVILRQLRREIEEQFLAPAVNELEAARGAGDDAELLGSTLALYRGDFAAAQRGAQRAAEHAQRAPAHAPPLLDATKLAADAAYGAAMAAVDRGDYDRARLELETATAQYAVAIDLARSDASTYRALAETWRARGELDFRQGRSHRAAFARALDLIDRFALAADPDDAATYLTRAHVLLRWYRASVPADRDDLRALLDGSAQAAARATELDLGDAQAWTSLGNAHVARCSYEREPDEAAPWCRQALEDYARALAIQPVRLPALNGLGAAHRWLGTHREAAGHDPVPEYLAALQAYQRASEIDPGYQRACTNQVDAQVVIAEYQLAVGDDPHRPLDEALRVGEACLKLDPKDYRLVDNLVQVQLAIARSLVEHGEDPGPALARARSYRDRAAAAQPRTMLAAYRQLIASDLQAEYLVRQARDPGGAIAAAQAALAEARSLATKPRYLELEAARLELVVAARPGATASGRDAALARALAHAENAIAGQVRPVPARLLAAEICAQIATHTPSREIVERGLTHVEWVHSRTPQGARAQRLRRELDGLLVK